MVCAEGPELVGVPGLSCMLEHSEKMSYTVYRNEGKFVEHMYNLSQATNRSERGKQKPQCQYRGESIPYQKSPARFNYMMDAKST
jgi:hypothetical protein